MVIGWGVPIALGSLLCHWMPEPIGQAIADTVYRISWGVFGILFACLLESKRVPTFPCRLFWRQSESKAHKRMLTGIQLTPSFGTALRLLQKHGLDMERREGSPVEAALESLTSTSLLMVAEAEDMNLMGCIDYLTAHCVNSEGELSPRYANMPIGKLLRAGSQHELSSKDMPILREKASKCLKV